MIRSLAVMLVVCLGCGPRPDADHRQPRFPNGVPPAPRAAQGTAAAGESDGLGAAEKP